MRHQNPRQVDTFPREISTHVTAIIHARLLRLQFACAKLANKQNHAITNCVSVYEASNDIGWVDSAKASRGRKNERETETAFSKPSQKIIDRCRIKVRIDDVGNHRLGNHRQNTLGRRETWTRCVVEEHHDISRILFIYGFFGQIRFTSRKTLISRHRFFSSVWHDNSGGTRLEASGIQQLTATRRSYIRGKALNAWPKMDPRLFWIVCFGLIAILVSKGQFF